MFLGVPEAGLDYPSTNQFRAPQPPNPLSKVSPQNQPSQQHWRREQHMSDTHRLPWSYSVNGLGDEDFNIPPITPPTLPDHMPPHLPHDSNSGQFHPLDPRPGSGSHHLYQLQGMELSGMTRGRDGAVLNQDGRTFSPDGGPMTSTLSVMQQMVNSDSRFTASQQPIEAALGPRTQSNMSQQSQLSTINQSQLGLGANSATHNSPSPSESKSATPSPSSSVHEDDHDDGLRHGIGAEKRPATVDIAKKLKTPKKKKRKDPNEPVKPVSAYALFFRDTQANIKAQNPNATFGEVSKIVASMWDGLGEEQKQVYKKKTETAKKEYLKQLAAYRASLVSQSYNDPSDVTLPHSSSSSSSTSSSTSMYTPKPSVYPGHPGQHPSTPSMAHSHPLPPHQHPGMYMSYPHPSHSSHASSPGLGPHLSPPHTQMHHQLQGLSSRGAMPQPGVQHQGALSLGSVVASSTPPLQVTPPLHNQGHLGGLHSPHHQHQHQHQQLSGHSMGMTHSPAITQGYLPPLQSDYQRIGGGMLNNGAVMSPSLDYHHQLGRHTPSHPPPLDWSTDYHSSRTAQRDKPLYLS
ncbi:thymocyte selection-associated high mobility group box protein TOX isoform X2 [Cynoglossus semilaevis]|nr:thymocyte selection-associated high mobility group box protein TOX isoform X2 [Cynoglossus semilaevis]